MWKRFYRQLVLQRSLEKTEITVALHDSNVNKCLAHNNIVIIISSRSKNRSESKSLYFVDEFERGSEAYLVGEWPHLPEPWVYYSILTDKHNNNMTCDGLPDVCNDLQPSTTNFKSDHGTNDNRLCRLPAVLQCKKKRIRFSDWSNQCDHIRQHLDIRYYLVKLLLLTPVFRYGFVAVKSPEPMRTTRLYD